MAQTSKHPSWGQRFLAVALVLAMLLAYLPGKIVPHAHAVTLAPQPEELPANRVVYVKAGGMNFDKATLDASSEEVLNLTGSIDYPIGSVELAMAFLSYRAADQDAVIVVMGEVDSTLSYNATETNCPLGSYEAHTGTYYITGMYNGTDYDGKISFTKSGNSNYCFGGDVVIENITLNRSADKWQNLHSNTSLIIGEGVNCEGYTAKLALLCGSYHSSGDLYSANSKLEVNSGAWGVIRGCSNTANMTSTEIVINGGTIDTVAAGCNTNAQTVDTVTVTVNGGTVIQLNYSGTGKAAPVTNNVIVNLNGGTVKEISKAAGTISADGSIAVNVGAAFDVNSISAVDINTTLGTEFNSVLNIAPGATAPSDAIAAEFSTVNKAEVVFVDKGGDLFAAIESLPAGGGTVVVRGDVSIAGTKTWTAKTGKITVTGVYNGYDYDPTIAVSASNKVIINCTSEVEFNNLSMNYSANSGYAAEIYAGPSLTIGYGMEFLRNGEAIGSGNNNNNGIICFRGGLLEGDIASTTMEFYSGQFSYIHGGSRYGNVTGTSYITLHPGVTVVDNIQLGATFQKVNDVECVINGADVKNIYVGSYANASDDAPIEGSIDLTIKNTTAPNLLGNRSGSATVSGDLNLTLDAAYITSWDNLLNGLTISGTKNLTVKNATDLRVANSLEGWASLALDNSTVWVDGVAYAGPAFTADAKSLLIVDDATETVPESAVKESAAVVYIGDGEGEYADFSAAYTALYKNSPNGGIVILKKNLTITYTKRAQWTRFASDTYTANVSNNKPVTITSEGDVTLSLVQSTGGAMPLAFRDITKFSNIKIDHNSTEAIEFWVSGELTFGEGVVTTHKGKDMATTAHSSDDDFLVVRLGDWGAAFNKYGKFVMHSGTLTHIHGGNNATASTAADIYVGKGATVVEFIQVGGTKMDMGTSNIVIDNANIYSIFLGGYGAGKVAEANVTVINSDIARLYGQRDNIYSNLGSTTGYIGDLSLTLENSYVSEWNLTYLALTEGTTGTSALTLKNYANLVFTDADLAWWKALTLDNAVIKMDGISYGGPSSVTVTDPSANAVGDILVSTAVYSELPTVTGTEVAYYDAHELVKTDAVEGTCTTAGNIAYWTCKLCGKHFSDEGKTEIAENEWVIPAGNHSLAKTDAKNATCLAPGHAAYWTCSVCGNNYTDEAASSPIENLETWLAEGGEGYAPQLDHVYNSIVDKCINGCGKTQCQNTGAHQSDSVACVDGLCVFCGEEMKATAPHDWSNKDGVCKTCGNTCESMDGHANGGTDHECDICGKTLSDHKYDNDCDAECNLCGETREIEGHDWSNKDGVCANCGGTCEDIWGGHSNETRDHDCDICGVEIDTCDDWWDDGLYFPPTFEADGYREYTCRWCGETKIVTNEGTKLIAVAQIGEEKFETLAEAIAVGGEIKLLADITLTEQVMIDKDVTITAENPATITVTILSGSTGAAFGGLHVTNGTLTLGTNVTVTNVGSAENGVSTVTSTGSNAKVVIDGATVKSECKNNAIEAANGSYVTILSGEVYGAQYTAAYASGDATIEVKGGKVSADGYYGLIASKTAATTGGNIIISGGEVQHVLAHEDANSSVTITDGTITGVVKANNGATISISGGIFENEVPEEYCAEGYVPTENQDGTYGVEVEVHVHNLIKVNEAAPGYTNPGNHAYWKCECGLFFDAEGNEIEEGSWIIPPRGTPNKVYVSDSGNDINTGLSADQAFKTLKQAYRYLAVYHPENESTIIICGKVTISENTTVLEAVTGKVTITSLDGEKDYADDGAQIYFSVKNVELHFEHNTELKDITLNANVASGFLFTGLNMVIGENVTTSGAAIKVFCCDSTPEATDNITVEVNSGDFDTIFMGCYTKGATNGNVTLTVDNDASPRLVVMGGSKGHAGNLIFNANGGDVEKLVHQPAGSKGKVESAIVNFNGAAVTDMLWYSGDTIGYVKSLIININSSNLPERLGVFGNSYVDDSEGAAHTPVTINVAANLNVTYAGKLPDLGSTIHVPEGSTLYLAAYEEGTLPAGTVVNASVGYTEGAETTGGTVLYLVTKVLGDADGDGFVDAFDASQIMKYSVGEITADSLNLSALDLDGDGHVDAFDASLIQKYSIGEITKFPVEEKIAS